MFSRVKLRLGNHCLAFNPDSLADAEMASCTLKRASAGALFENPSALDNSMAEVVWEVILSCDPPACVKPSKPKYWLMGKVSMQKDMIYRVL